MQAEGRLMPGGQAGPLRTYSDVPSPVMKSNLRNLATLAGPSTAATQSVRSPTNAVTSPVAVRIYGSRSPPEYTNSRRRPDLWGRKIAHPLQARQPMRSRTASPQPLRHPLSLSISAEGCAPRRPLRIDWFRPTRLLSDCRNALRFPARRGFPGTVAVLRGTQLCRSARSSADSEEFR